MSTPLSTPPYQLEVRGNIDFPQLYDLFVRSGFMPDDKAQLIAAHRPAVEHTFTQLDRGGPLLNWMLARGPEGAAVGYLSTVWCYRRTTMFQHLSGLPGSHTGGALVVELMEQIIAEPQFDFMKFYFLADNPYPARIYGSFGDSADDGRTCTMKSYAHIVSRLETRPGPAGTDIEVRAAEGQDLDLLDEFLATHESVLVRQAEDLSPHQWTLESLNRRYQHVHLFRQRQVLIATRGREPLGFALVELSSPGLNLSEGLSAFRTVVLDSALHDEDRVREALLHGIQDVYRHAGRAVALGLVDPADVPSYQRLGLSSPAVSKCIVMHRSRFAAFRDHVARLTRYRTRVLAGVR